MRVLRARRLSVILNSPCIKSSSGVEDHLPGRCSIRNYTSYGTGAYNTLAGLGSPNAANLIPDLVGPTLTANSGVWAATSPTLTLIGSNLLPNATYSVTFTASTTITVPATYSSSTTLTVSNLSVLSGLAPGTALTAQVTMTVPAGSTSYSDTLGPAVPVASGPSATWPTSTTSF